ncbi:MAG: ATP-binding protein [Flavisolibacter sp.]
MNRFFRKLPLPAKLMLIGFVPLLFLIFLTLQLYIQKSQKLAILERYIHKFDESATITRLIDNLQAERRFSYEYVLNRNWGPEMLVQRKKTDSLISVLSSNRDTTMKGFENYSFLVNLEQTRNNIDSGVTAANHVMHYFSATIFRLNTLNGVTSGNNAYLSHVYNDMMSQKLISEMITYLGLIDANIFNILYNRAYVVETLMGTLPSYEVYQSYEKEFLQKSSPEIKTRYNQIRYGSALDENIQYLDKVFSTFNVDSTYDYTRWGALTSKGINDLRFLQSNLLQSVQERMNNSYSREVANKWTTLAILIIALILVLIIVSYTIHIINSMLNELKGTALKIAKGEAVEPLKNVPNDVIGSLARSINEINKSNEQLASAANSIGNGNFEVDLKPRSSGDQLGNALLRMKENLQYSIKETEESREQFRKLADFVPQIIWTATTEGEVDYFNNQWYEFSGAESSPGTAAFLPFVHQDDQEPCLGEWNKAVRTGRPYEVEYRLLGKNQQYRWFLGRAVPVRNAEGIIIKWFGTCTDIHDRKERSELLESLVQQRTKELERSNDDLKQFAHVASHDLKEPMRKIRMFSSRLYDDYAPGLPVAAQDYLVRIQDAAGRMSAMIDGVLNYSVTTNVEEQFEDIDLNQVMSEIVQDLELSIQQKQARISFDSLPVIRGIRILIYQLFYNLIGNALKFSREDEQNHITILVKLIKGHQANGITDLHPNREYFSITVKDRGIGFDPENEKKMFQLFSRLNARHRYEGTGLGLALCKKIVLRHNGNINAEGRENEGASFTVYLPV